MSIPGMSGGISAGMVGSGELPPMSIPGMSIGMSLGLGGAGGSSNPKPAETAAALIGAAAEAWSYDVSIKDPRIAAAATVAPTEATAKRRCHVAASPLIWMFLALMTCSTVKLIE